MKFKTNTNINCVPTCLKKMRESSGLTMRQAAGIIGFSHVSISQFENRKLDLPDYRIEQMVKAYGFTLADFHKIIGKTPITNPKEDCLAMLDRMDDEQLVAVRAIMNQLLRTTSSNFVPKTIPKKHQTQTTNLTIIA